MLSDLESLARESSSAKRRDLLNGITQLFLDGAEQHNDREVALYADVVLQVLDSVELEGRIEFSNAVAHQAATPASVARRLAHDEIEVARPVLQHSPVLGDLDLIKVAERRSPEHLYAISVRTALSAEVTDSLIRRGDDKVIRSVSGNRGARFSDSGLQRMVVHASEDETVRSNLVAREDLREDLMEKVLPVISGANAAKLRLLLENASDDVSGAALNQMEKEIHSASQGRLEVRQMVKQVLAGAHNIDDALIALSDQARIGDIALLISRLAGIQENVVSNVLFKANNDPIAIMCKAIGATPAGFRAVQQLRARRLRLPDSHLERGARDFARLSDEAAKRSLRFVKLRAQVA